MREVLAAAAAVAAVPKPEVLVAAGTGTMGS